MKIKTRLGIAFITITLVPMLLIYLAFSLLSRYQMRAFRDSYGLTEQVDLLSGNSMQVFNRLTQTSQKAIQEKIRTSPDSFADLTFLETVNQDLKSKYAYLIVRKGDEIIFSGSELTDSELYQHLPDHDGREAAFMEGGIYLDGDTQHLIKQVDFQYSDGADGSVFIVSSLDDFIPEVKSMLAEILFSSVMIILLAGVMLTG